MRQVLISWFIVKQTTEMKVYELFDELNNEIFSQINWII